MARQHRNPFAAHVQQKRYKNRPTLKRQRNHLKSQLQPRWEQHSAKGHPMRKTWYVTSEKETARSARGSTRSSRRPTSKGTSKNTSSMQQSDGTRGSSFVTSKKRTTSSSPALIDSTTLYVD